jgi:hypothetical protein
MLRSNSRNPSLDALCPHGLAAQAARQQRRQLTIILGL